MTLNELYNYAVWANTNPHTHPGGLLVLVCPRTAGKKAGTDKIAWPRYALDGETCLSPIGQVIGGTSDGYYVAFKALELLGYIKAVSGLSGGYGQDRGLKWSRRLGMNEEMPFEVKRKIEQLGKGERPGVGRGSKGVPNLNRKVEGKPDGRVGQGKKKVKEE